MLTADALKGYKDYTKRVVAYAKYKVGNTYYQTAIHKREDLPNGKAAIYILIDHTVPGNITVTEIQLYDTDNKLWLSKPEQIYRSNVQEGVLYRFTFDFEER